MHWVTARSSYKPSAIAQFTIQHAAREQLALSFGWGDSPTVPLETWQPSFFDNRGGALGFDGVDYSANPLAAPDGTFMFDCSDFVTRGVEQYYMLVLNDTSDATLGGTIKSFQMLDGDGSVWATCPAGDGPGEIPKSDWDRIATLAVATVASPLSALIVDSSQVRVAEGGTAGFGLRMQASPSQPVTVQVAVAGGDPTIHVTDGQALTFNTTNWNTFQRVTLAANEDADALNGSATITCSAAALDTISLTALSLDDDHAVYYVNDGVTTNDQWCTATGNDANDGRSPDHPKASVQAIVDDYQLLPGDRVRVDTGLYTLSANILVGPSDSGDALGQVEFEASPYGVLFQRGDAATATAYCWDITASYVTLTTASGTAHSAVPERFMKLTGGYYGARVAGSYCTVERVETCGNAQSGLCVDDAQTNHVTLRNCLVHDSTADDAREVRIRDADQVRVENCTVVAGGQYAITCYYSDDVKLVNNVLVARGDGNGCVFVNSSPLFSDYNDLYASSGATVGVFSGGHQMATLGDWQTDASVDANSLGADPLFVDSEAGDYHEQSLAGSYHNGLWVADGVSSPVIDAGNPASAFTKEPTFNGGRVNLGAYGNTGQASRTSINLDADGNGALDALADGILILRYLFDPGGAWIVNDALGCGAERTTRGLIKGYLDCGTTTALDVDGNGSCDPLSDGILILRYLFDPTGAWNVNDALGSGATRTTWEEIGAHLDGFNPAIDSWPGVMAEESARGIPASGPPEDAPSQSQVALLGQLQTAVAQAVLMSTGTTKSAGFGQNSIPGQADQAADVRAVDSAMHSWDHQPAQDAGLSWIPPQARVARAVDHLWQDGDLDRFPADRDDTPDARELGQLVLPLP